MKDAQCDETNGKSIFRTKNSPNILRLLTLITDVHQIYHFFVHILTSDQKCHTYHLLKEIITNVLFIHCIFKTFIHKANTIYRYNLVFISFINFHSWRTTLEPSCIHFNH